MGCKRLLEAQDKQFLPTSTAAKEASFSEKEDSWDTLPTFRSFSEIQQISGLVWACIIHPILATKSSRLLSKAPLLSQQLTVRGPF